MSDWLWLGAVTVLVVMQIWSRNMAYKHGIWDGAFNQSLPHVRRAMREYRPDLFPEDDDA